VAITAINAVIANVMFVTELDRLLAFDPLACVPGRAADLGAHPKSGQENEHRSKDRCSGQRVSAVMKNLWHRRNSAINSRARILGAALNRRNLNGKDPWD